MTLGELSHFGILGMKWGVRKEDVHSGLLKASSAIQKMSSWSFDTLTAPRSVTKQTMGESIANRMILRAGMSYALKAAGAGVPALAAVNLSIFGIKVARQGIQMYKNRRSLNG